MSSDPDIRQSSYKFKPEFHDHQDGSPALLPMRCRGQQRCKSSIMSLENLPLTSVLTVRLRQDCPKPLLQMPGKEEGVGQEGCLHYHEADLRRSPAACRSQQAEEQDQGSEAEGIKSGKACLKHEGEGATDKFARAQMRGKPQDRASGRQTSSRRLTYRYHGEGVSRPTQVSQRAILYRGRATQHQRRGIPSQVEHHSSSF